MLLIIILSTVVSGALSYYVIKPTYEAKATIVVGKAADTGSNDNSKYEFDDVMMFQKLVKTYAEIGKSVSVAESASARLNNISAKNILHDTTVTPMADTQLIEFKARNRNPQTAYSMIIAVYNSFLEQAQKIYPGQNIQVMDKAEIPKKPIKPKKILNIVIGFFIGLMASVGLIFLLEYKDNTLKTEQDINKYLDLPVIGVIPKNNEKY